MPPCPPHTPTPKAGSTAEAGCRSTFSGPSGRRWPLAAGRSDLRHATTGASKTYAVALGALGRAAGLGTALQGAKAPPLGVLWITPMRALAADTHRALAQPLADLAPAWTLGLRTGDTPSGERAKQDRRAPTVLVSTPESVTLLLTRPDAAERLAAVHTVIVDEWHELVGNKRGVQVQLLLARLAGWNPRLLVWGLSATLGNLDEAMAMLQGPQPPGDAPPALVRGRLDKTLVIDTLLPPNPGRFAWGGHLGAQMQQPVADEIARTAAEGGVTLVFTNVRSQAEAWYQLCCWRSGPIGPARSRCTTAHWPRRCVNGWRPG